MIRIVKMEFEPEKVDEFLKYFDTIKEKVRAQEGCHHLELLQDINTPHVLFTYSIWDDESYLNKYRNTSFFKEVWTNTKKHFNAKPGAWSVQTIAKLN